MPNNINKQLPLREIIAIKKIKKTLPIMYSFVEFTPANKLEYIEVFVNCSKYQTTLMRVIPSYKKVSNIV